SGAPRRTASDRTAVAFWHSQVLQLADSEETELSMLPADVELPQVQAPHGVSNNQHLFSRQHLIKPAIEHPIRDNIGTEFLGKLAPEAGERIFAAFQPTTGELPLVPFIQEKYDPAFLQEDTLHRYRKPRFAIALEGHLPTSYCSRSS